MRIPLAVLLMLAALLVVVVLELLEAPHGRATDRERGSTWARTAGVAVVLGALALTLDWAAEYVDRAASMVHPRSALDAVPGAVVEQLTRLMRESS